MKYKSFSIALVVFIVAILVSCSDNPIFYNLEREVLIEDGNLNNGISFNNFYKVTSGGDYYVASGKEIWYRLITDEDWTRIPNPDGYDKSVSGTTGMVYYDDRLISAFYTEPGNGATALFSSSTFPVVSASDWTENTDSKVRASGDADTDLYYTRYYMFVVNGQLFINKVNYHNYYDDGEQTDIDDSQVYHFPNNAIDVSLNGNVTMPASFSGTLIKDIIYDGVRYWIIYNTSGGGKIATGGPTNFTELGTADIPDSYNYNSIFSHAGTGLIMLSTTKGDLSKNYIYFSQNAGVDWFRISINQNKVSCFIDISEYTVAPADAMILAGCQSYVDSSGSTNQSDGYFQIDITTPSSPDVKSNSFSDDDNFDSSDLSSASIRSFFSDPAEETLFALTWNKGLWRNSTDGSTRSWVWE